MIPGNRYNVRIVILLSVDVQKVVKSQPCRSGGWLGREPKVKKIVAVCLCSLLLTVSSAMALSLWGKKSPELKPVNNVVEIPLASISDGKAHHYKVKAQDGTMVTFFVIKSKDGVIRAAIDACDVCFRAGKGYTQQGDYMVCENCGQKFASNRINDVKGGCNPAPLNRKVVGEKLVIAMQDINTNSWYCKFKK